MFSHSAGKEKIFPIQESSDIEEWLEETLEDQHNSKVAILHSYHLLLAANGGCPSHPTILINRKRKSNKKLEKKLDVVSENFSQIDDFHGINKDPSEETTQDCIENILD
jgi:hypothetical protein